MIRVAPCGRDAALYSVTHWHYSGKLPSGRLAMFGVWENDRFIGSVIFGYGASQYLGAAYGLSNGSVVELVRIALDTHQAPVSQIATEAIRQYRTANPQTRLVVSFADPQQDHHGGVYQAMNFIYAGTSTPREQYWVHGKEMHMRSLSALRSTRGVNRNNDTRDRLTWLRDEIDPDAYTIVAPGKHRYLLPLDKSMRRQINHLHQPHPTRDH